jgi:hypothetical protein
MLYSGSTLNVFEMSAPEDAITMSIEFARLANMCHITGMESLIARYIKAVILKNSAAEDNYFDKWKVPDANTYCLSSQSNISAVTRH